MIAASRMFLFAVLISLGTIELATAKVVRWDLQNVTFESFGEQSSASGFFLFDADASPDKRLVSWDITITNFVLPAYRFIPASGVTSGGGWFDYPKDDQSCFNSLGCIVFLSRTLLEIDPIGRTAILLYLFPESPLSDAGGHIALGGYEHDTYYGWSDQFIVTGGLVAAVPEASQILLLIVGFIALGLLRWKLRDENAKGARLTNPGSVLAKADEVIR